MDKVKFIGLMILVILLSQISILNDFDEIGCVVYVCLGVIIWFVETIDIEKDTKIKKFFIYGFAFFWIILSLIMKMNIRFFLSFIFEDFWVVSPIIIFILSKIFWLKRYIVNDKNTVILLGILFTIGYIIAYIFHTMFFYSDIQTNLIYILSIINLMMLVFELFKLLKIQNLDRKFIIIVILVTSAIIAVITIMNIAQINKYIKSQQELLNFIKSGTLTYKNIQIELKPYLEKYNGDELDKLSNSKFLSIKKDVKRVNYNILYLMNENIMNQKYTKKDSKLCANTLETYAQMLDSINISEKNYETKIIIVSSIEIIGVIVLGIYSIRKQQW